MGDGCMGTEFVSSSIFFEEVVLTSKYNSVG